MTGLILDIRNTILRERPLPPPPSLRAVILNQFRDVVGNVHYRRVGTLTFHPYVLGR
jgi:hypothetical protein